MRDAVIRRIGRLCDGWFVLCSPQEFPGVKNAIAEEARAAGRNPDNIGTEAGVAVVGEREAEWRDRVANWRKAGLDYLCLRTLGADLSPAEHIKKLQEVVPQIPD